MKATVPEQPRLFAPLAAVRVGKAILIGFAVVIVAAAIDRAQREQLETTQEVTAVGDRAFFPVPVDLQKPPPAVATFRGESLYPVSFKPVEVRDTKMIRAGKDDSGNYFVYNSRESVPAAEGEVEAKDVQFFFLKLAPGEYLKTRTTTPGK